MQSLFLHVLRPKQKSYFSQMQVCGLLTGMTGRKALACVFQKVREDVRMALLTLNPMNESMSGSEAKQNDRACGWQWVRSPYLCTCTHRHTLQSDI